MKFFRRLRWWALLPLPLAVIALQSFGPDGWREPAQRLLWLSWASVALAATHLGCKALHDYADGAAAWQQAMAGNIAAGLAFLGRCILGGMIFTALMGYARGADVGATVPPRAHQLAPLAVQQIERVWPGMPMRSYLGALVEQETCPSLQHRMCWSCTAQLKTDREEGASLGQLTRAYAANGSVRFDALAEVKTLDPEGLRELNWQSVYQRADLSLRAIVVKLRDCHQRLARQADADAYNLTAFCDAAYNGGYGGLLADRRLCALTEGCNPNTWFGHVERHSGKSRTKWQGYGKSAFEINREHVHMALQVRRPKYVALLGD